MCVCVYVCVPNTYVFITGCGIFGDLPTVEYQTINDSFTQYRSLALSVSAVCAIHLAENRCGAHQAGKPTREYNTTEHRQHNYNLSLSTRILQYVLQQGWGVGGGGGGLSQTEIVSGGWGGGVGDDATSL